MSPQTNMSEYYNSNELHTLCGLINTNNTSSDCVCVCYKCNKLQFVYAAHTPVNICEKCNLIICEDCRNQGIDDGALIEDHNDGSIECTNCPVIDTSIQFTEDDVQEFVILASDAIDHDLLCYCIGCRKAVLFEYDYYETLDDVLMAYNSDDYSNITTECFLCKD